VGTEHSLVRSQREADRSTRQSRARGEGDKATCTRDLQRCWRGTCAGAFPSRRAVVALLFPTARVSLIQFDRSKGGKCPTSLKCTAEIYSNAKRATQSGTPGA